MVICSCVPTAFLCTNCSPVCRLRSCVPAAVLCAGCSPVCRLQSCVPAAVLCAGCGPAKLLKHFIVRTFAFFLSALLIPHASAPYNAVGTISPSLLGLYLQSSIVQHIFHHSPRSIPLIHSVYHINFTSSISCHLLMDPH